MPHTDSNLLKVIEWARINRIEITFSFQKIPGHLAITVSEPESGKEDTQVLPDDHLYDEKIMDCIAFTINKLI